VAAFALIAAISACSSSSKKSSSSASSTNGSTATTVGQALGATTSIAPGDDQKDSPFCQDVGKLDKITDPSDGSVGPLVADAKSHAPQSISSQFTLIANYIQQAAVSKTTNTSLSTSDQTALAGAFEAVAGYAVAHCGFNLTAP
jgi:hypothetical protein